MVIIIMMVWEQGAENCALHDSPLNNVVLETWLNKRMNEQYERLFLPNWLTETESRHQAMKSTSAVEAHSQPVKQQCISLVKHNISGLLFLGSIKNIQVEFHSFVQDIEIFHTYIKLQLKPSWSVSFFWFYVILAVM